jgi:hypothetical protein
MIDSSDKYDHRQSPLYVARRYCTTQIGSLPFRDVDQAIAYSLQHDIPFLPELTALGDAMLHYIQNPGHLSCLEKFKTYEFETVKVQCIGPATLIASGYEENDALLRIYTHIESIIKDLRAQEIILFLDEPALGYVGFDYERLWAPIFESFSVIRGVHVCGNMQWDQLFNADIDIISFDASNYDITKYYKDRKGKRIAWGIQRAEDIKDFQRGDLITPPCGLGTKLFTEADAVAKLAQLRELAERYRSSL